MGRGTSGSQERKSVAKTGKKVAKQAKAAHKAKARAPAKRAHKTIALKKSAKTKPQKARAVAKSVTKKPRIKVESKPIQKPVAPAAKPVTPIQTSTAKPVALDPRRKANGKTSLPLQAKVVPKSGEIADPNAQREDADSPLLDMSDVAVRKMVTKAKARGYVTYDELNKVLPSEKVSSEQIEDTMSMLSEMGINVIESEEQEEQPEGAVPATTATGKAVVAKADGEDEPYDRTDDPVRMYLREMGSVELLSREGEIAIAKRIEAGREAMIAGLCESPLTFQAIIIWRDELVEGRVLLRDIIDLEATYAGP